MGAALADGDVVGAHLLTRRRLAELPSWRVDPAAGLELKDALHVATFCALGAGDLRDAGTAARGQQELPFLRHRRDLADDELAAPAALSGNLDDAIDAGRRFLHDWNAAGRPAAAGRGLAPAAVAFAHGLRGDRHGREEWLGVLAEIRGVPRADSNRGSGYGQLFEALRQPHRVRHRGTGCRARRGAHGGPSPAGRGLRSVRGCVRGRADAAALFPAGQHRRSDLRRPGWCRYPEKKCSACFTEQE